MTAHDSPLLKEVSVELMPTPPREVLPYIRRAANYALTMSGHHGAIEHLEKQSRMDSMTGLKNRKAYDETLVATIEKAHQEGLPLAVANIDLDGLKALNDDQENGGHPEGDRYIQTVADALIDTINEGDNAFRLSEGDEFALILDLAHLKGSPDTAVFSQAEHIQTKLDYELNEAVLRASFPPEHYLGVSIGVAILEPGETPESIHKRADRYMYDHKNDKTHRLQELGITIKRRSSDIEDADPAIISFEDPRAINPFV